jgi:hypothetical protein
MSALENPSENPCFGCGPQHPRGLRLSFERTTLEDGTEAVRTEFTPKADEIGWPGLYHHSLHFAALYEASYWAALTLGGKLWISVGPITYDSQRLPRVGIGHTATARIVKSSDEHLEIEAISATRLGKPCGVLRSSWIPASKATIDRAQIHLPDYLLAEVGP